MEKAFDQLTILDCNLRIISVINKLVNGQSVQKIIVCAVIFQGGKVLVVLRESGSLEGDKWEFPGGKVEFGEHPEDALHREIREELDVEIEIQGVISVSSAILKDNTHYVMIAYRCSLISGSIHLKVGQSYSWINADEIPSYHWAKLDIPLLPEIVKYIE